jgi:hypothetical protein
MPLGLELVPDLRPLRGRPFGPLLDPDAYPDAPTGRRRTTRRKIKTKNRGLTGPARSGMTSVTASLFDGSFSEGRKSPRVIQHPRHPRKRAGDTALHLGRDRPRRAGRIKGEPRADRIIPILPTPGRRPS